MGNGNAVLPVAQETKIVQVTTTPLDLLREWLGKGLDIEQMKILQEMHRDHEMNEARKAYIRAMAGFRAESITILKNRRVSFTTAKGTTAYDHATLDAALEVCVPKLSEHGLFHRWETVQDGTRITVTCIISHQDGFSERTALSAAPDESGGKNSIQAVGSTVSYLERYTFLAATGLAAKGQDDDARTAREALITAGQVKQIEKLIAQAGADRDLLLKWAKVEALEELPARKLGPVCERLNDMIEQAG